MPEKLRAALTPSPSAASGRGEEPVPSSRRWWAAVWEGLVFALVLGACITTPCQEHQSSLRWLLDVASTGLVPGALLAIALAIKSPFRAATVATILGGVAILGPAAWEIQRWGMLSTEPLLLGSSLALAAFVLGRLLRCRRAERGQFTLRTLLLLPLLVAATAAAAIGGQARGGLALAVALAALLTARAGYRLTFATPEEPACRWPLAVGLTLGCLYLPFAWLLLIQHPWDSTRLGYLAAIPLLPGVAGVWLETLVTRSTPGMASLPLSLGATLLFFGLVSWLAQRGRWATVLAALLGLAIAGFSSWMVYAVFRA